MKHLFRSLLLIAVLIAPLLGHAQTTPSPSPSPSTNVETTVEGKVLLEGSNVPVKQGTQVTFIDNDDKRYSTFTTDNGSYYFIASDRLHPGAYRVQITHYSYVNDDLIVTLSPGANHKNLIVTLREKNNSITGKTYRMANGLKKDVPGVYVVAINKATGARIDSDTSNVQGNYGMYDDALDPSNSPMLIYAKNADGKRISQAVEVSFTELIGDEEKEIDLEITEIPTYKYTLHVTTFDNTWALRDGDTPVPGVAVTVRMIGGGIEKSGTTNAKGTVTFSDLPSGTYAVKGTKTGYEEGRDSIDLIGIPHKEGESLVLNLLSDAYTCEKHPQATVKEFWFCGEVAKRLYPQRMGAWQAIDQKVAQIRARYNTDIYSNLPQQIVVESVSYYNAFYGGAKGDSVKCRPLEIIDPKFPGDGETVTFTTGFIKGSTDTILAHTVSHEVGGHGRDFRKGKCKSYWSEKEPFRSIFGLGSAYGAQYFDNLNDSTYDKAEGGHAEDEAAETYASAFHAMWDHKAEFPKNAQGILRDLLIKTGELALEP